MKETNLFDCLDAINKKIPYTYKKKDCTAYMMLMWMSHNTECLPYVDRLNERLFEMPDDLVFAALYKGIPKANRFIKWDKGSKTSDITKKKEAIIKDIQDEHGFSKFEASTLFKRYVED